MTFDLCDKMPSNAPSVHGITSEALEVVSPIHQAQDAAAPSNAFDGRGSMSDSCKRRLSDELDGFELLAVTQELGVSKECEVFQKPIAPKSGSKTAGESSVSFPEGVDSVWRCGAGPCVIYLRWLH